MPWPISLHLCDPEAVEPLRRGMQGGRVTASTQERLVRVRWSIDWIAFMGWSHSWVDRSGARVAYEPMSPSMFDHLGREQGVQTLEASFFPLSLAVEDDEHILVAGIDAEGLTIVERWTFEWPAQMPQPQLDRASGEERLEVVQPERSRVERLFVHDFREREWIGPMALIRAAEGPTERALVLLARSRELGELDLATGRLTTIACPEQRRDGLGPVPELDELPVERLSVHGRGIGFAYVFGRAERTMGCGRTRPPSRLVMLDADGDCRLGAHAVECRRPAISVAR